MNSTKKIVLTGGGTAGHVTPNMALIPYLQKEGYEVSYVGSYTGIEKELISEMGVPYYGIATGKLRRYWDKKNLSDPFRVIKGFFQARSIIKKIDPDIVFSKGGFVSVPVVFAAKQNKVPVIIHESDMTPGLANKLSIPCAKKVCCNFPETVSMIKNNAGILTGTPIRPELMNGDRQTGLDICGFTSTKPVIMVMGGSLGAQNVNKYIRAILPELTEQFQVVHLCGKGKLDTGLLNIPGYKQFEYIKSELKDLFAAADLFISRAGANSIFELKALAKPNLLIPLSRQASRGDQILNANSFVKQGFSQMLDEETISADFAPDGKGNTKPIKDTVLYKTIISLYENREQYTNSMRLSNENDSISTIVRLIKENSRK